MLKDTDQKILIRTDDAAVIENYIVDESSIFHGSADSVVYPRDEYEVSEIFKEANDKKIKITISGAGTGVTGSRVPLGGWVLSTELLTNIESRPSDNGKIIRFKGLKNEGTIFLGYDKDGPYAISPPGISLALFKKLVEQEGFYYPPDPTESSASLGGTLATNASGARTYHYGSTRDYVRRIRVVIPEGNVLNIKRGEVFAKDNKFEIMKEGQIKYEIKLPGYVMPDVKKNAAGYFNKPGMDLIDLFIGSEGTLGLITEIELKLLSKPSDIYTFFAVYNSESEAIELVKKLKTEKDEQILAIEFFDANSISVIRETYPAKIPAGSKSIIYFELNAFNDKNLYHILELVKDCDYLFSNKGFSINTILLSEEEAKDIRHSLPESINFKLRSLNLPKVATDIAVPEGKLDEMLEAYHAVGTTTNVNYALFGHIGDNHLHFNFIPANQQELNSAIAGCVLLWKKGISLGGTVTAEHGVGKKFYIEGNEKKPLLELMYGRDELMEIARIKHVLDPTHILNVGNIVPEDILDISCHS
ncbi:MAG: FAD-binding oxidoreductase [Thermoplasmata archaeon]